MLTVTRAAAEQILRAADEADMEEPLLRVAARVDETDGRIEYGMGFDERREQDEEFDCEGVIVLVSPPSFEPLSGTVLDYVEIAPGDFRFVFSRAGQDAPDSPAPNKPESQSEAHAGCGDCGCGKRTRTEQHGDR
jgi:iron-sulfur cluster assembly protein